MVWDWDSGRVDWGEVAVKSYLQFVDGPPSASGKTKTWIVRHMDGTSLGPISWHAPWRKYVYYPIGDSLFDAACLMDISLFLTQQMAKHKER